MRVSFIVSKFKLIFQVEFILLKVDTLLYLRERERPPDLYITATYRNVVYNFVAFNSLVGNNAFIKLNKSGFYQKECLTTSLIHIF